MKNQSLNSDIFNEKKAGFFINPAFIVKLFFSIY